MQEIASYPRFELDPGDAQRSLTVNARMLLCLLPDFDQVSITVVDDAGGVSTLAQAGDLVTDLDQLQYGLGEGPSIDSLRAAYPVVAAHIQRDDRWRRYVPAASELGLRSQVATPLRWQDDKPLGALNMYSTTHARVGFSAPVVAEVMAAQIVSALVGLRELEHLHRALADRTVVGQAIGLVMAWLRVDADHASDYLGDVANRQNRELAELAEEMVRTRELPSVRPE